MLPPSGNFETRMMHFLSMLGPLRVLLALGLLLLAAAQPFSGGEVQYSGWLMFTTLIAPAVIPIAFFVLLLDMLMSGVFLSSAEDAVGRRRYRTILWVELGLLAMLLAVWGPYFTRLTQVD
ncbi:MAG: hypothetical protein LJE84_13010 [Gammaproteobacteria bacterium]|nr:hypothetical protein [Gammaproteobacteria bacterium]